MNNINIKKESSTLKKAELNELNINDSTDRDKGSTNKKPVSICKLIKGKVDSKQIAQYQHLFTPMELTSEELITEIQHGHAYCTVFKEKRTAENFHKAGYISLDFDQGLTLEEIREDEFIKNNAAFIYTTPSHRQGNHGDRFRVVFEFENPVDDKDKYINLLVGLLNKYQQADQSCKDPTRLYFGSPNCEVFRFDQCLSQAQVEKLSQNIEQTRKKKSTANSNKSKIHDGLPLEEIKEMLKHLDPIPGYETWIKIIWAVKSWAITENIGDDMVKNLIEEWSPDYKTNGLEVDKLLSNYEHGKISVGTLIHLATQRKYELPACYDHPRTEGQVAYEDLFSESTQYASIGENLYCYNDGFFELTPDEILRKKVSDYFDNYITNFKTGRNGFASQCKVETAIKYIKTRYYRNPEDINPPGVNLKNGYLRLSYDDSGKPVFDLLPHSPEYFFTYKADFEYNPDADDCDFNNVIDDILDKKQQDILFRSIAATFDITEVRIRKGRAVRISLLYGEGSNGKDTIREWLYKLYCKNGMTFIGLDAFKSADSGRLFGLFDLATSKINWSSENKAIALDHCQSLKNCATGDPISLEQKHKQGFAIKPKSVMFFNINQIPRIEAQQEAIASRYGILHFKNIFKEHPNEDDPREKKANPRLKEDENYILSEIMPPLLNRLIDEYKNLLKDGIDYSCNKDLFTEIKEDNDHLIEFCNANGLKECSLTDGLNPELIHLRYIKWCKKYKMIEEIDNGKLIYNDPSPYDRIIRDVRQMSLRLRDVFPRMDKTKTGQRGRVLGLNFMIEEDDLQ